MHACACVCCSVLQCVAVWRSVVQCFVVCCSVLRCHRFSTHKSSDGTLTVMAITWTQFWSEVRQEKCRGVCSVCLSLPLFLPLSLSPSLPFSLSPSLSPSLPRSLAPSHPLSLSPGLLPLSLSPSIPLSLAPSLVLSPSLSVLYGPKGNMKP